MSRFEEEERMRKYLQGQRRQGLDKVKWKIDFYLAVCRYLVNVDGLERFSKTEQYW